MKTTEQLVVEVGIGTVLRMSWRDTALQDAKDRDSQGSGGAGGCGYTRDFAWACRNMAHNLA